MEFGLGIKAAEFAQGFKRIAWVRGAKISKAKISVLRRRIPAAVLKVPRAEGLCVRRLKAAASPLKGE